MPRFLCDTLCIDTDTVLTVRRQPKANWRDDDVWLVRAMEDGATVYFECNEDAALGLLEAMMADANPKPAQRGEDHHEELTKQH
jgi:hypothetical protein